MLRYNFENPPDLTIEGEFSPPLSFSHGWTDPEFLGIHIKLPKIPIGRIIGNAVSDFVPGGGAIVKAADTAIDIAKGTKLTLPKVTTGVVTKAIDAGAAQIKNNLSAATTKSAQSVVTNQVSSGLNQLLVPAIAVAVLFLIIRGK